MQNTTEPPLSSVGLLPPPLPMRPIAARPMAPPNIVDQTPVLPLVAPSVPKPQTPPMANPFATSLNPTPPSGAPRRQGSGGGARRFFSWMLLLALIGGITFAAITYGPELMDRASGDEAIDEPEAPLAFPVPATPAAPARTATYTVERTDAAGNQFAYTATVDFESGLSKVTLDREGTPDLEMMAVFDDSVIHRVGEPTWYRVQRGDFPLDASQGRSRWVRTVDETLPPALRSIVTIERATESSVGDVPARRLLLSVDPQALVDALGAPPANAGEFSDPATPAPATPVLPPGMVFNPDIDRTVPIEIEMWVDATGLVRKLVLPAALGGETITVTSLSAEAFTDAYPTNDVIQPLTAQALLQLGL